LYENINHLLGEDMAKSVCSDWCKVRVSENGYVDHQSRLALPVSRKRTDYGQGLHMVDKEFFDELFRYYQQENLVIVGGNDNEEHRRFTEGRQPHVVPTESSGVFVCRKDGQWWTLMNRFSGAKIRLSLQKDPKPYVKAKSPELVDLKITNYCPFGCDYCYQDSTENGKHGDIKKIDQILMAMDDLEVFEVAIGGGEPTMSPHFAYILKQCKRHSIVPNFTTRNHAWLKDESITELVRESTGRFAYSVDNSMDAYRIYMAVEAAKLLNDHNERRLSFQYVMGSGSQETFKSVVKAACDLHCDLTLLGFKEVGRGKGYQYWDYSKEWLNVLEEMKKDKYIPRIGIDTALANEAKNELYKKKYEPLVCFKEGTFSMYIDAVEMRMGPSSFCDTDEYVPFKDDRDFSTQIEMAFRSFGNAK